MGVKLSQGKNVKGNNKEIALGFDQISLEKPFFAAGGLKIQSKRK
jgi:hypothetical protein